MRGVLGFGAATARKYQRVPKIGRGEYEGVDGERGEAEGLRVLLIEQKGRNAAARGGLRRIGFAGCDAGRALRTGSQVKGGRWRSHLPPGLRWSLVC